MYLPRLLGPFKVWQIHWRVCVQIMPEKDTGTYHINPFDLTKVCRTAITP